MSQLSSRIAYVLDRFQLTSDELAKYAEVSTTDVQAWLDNRDDVSLEAAIAIQAELGVNLKWLRFGEAPKLVAHRDAMFTDEIASLADHLSAQQMGTLLRVAEGLLQRTPVQLKLK